LHRGTPRSRRGPEGAVKGVFQVIAKRIDPGEVDRLIKVFPENLQALWVAGDAFG
jgi:uncharacterized protein (DUF2267 family)